MQETARQEAANIALVDRYTNEVMNDHKLDVADQLFDANFSQAAFVGKGPQGVKDFMNALLIAIPDLRAKVEEVIADKNTIVVRYTFTGTNTGPWPWFNITKGTNKPLSFQEVIIFHIEDGKIMSRTFHPDLFGALSQIGAVGAPHYP